MHRGRGGQSCQGAVDQLNHVYVWRFSTWLMLMHQPLSLWLKYLMYSNKSTRLYTIGYFSAFSSCKYQVQVEFLSQSPASFSQ